MSAPNETRELIAAARAVAKDASGANIARLLQAVMDLPFDQMPAEYLNQPIPLSNYVKRTIGSRLREASQDASRD